jgi:hypothetical protein
MWTAVILLVLHSHTFMMAQTDKHGKPTPVHNKSIPAFNMELELMHSTKGKQLVPTDNSEQLASFHVGVPLVERGFNRGHAVSGVQAGPSSRDSPNSERPEQWGRCNTCNSRVHDLSEWDDIPTCSVCRKKVNDPDPLLLRPMDVELQVCSTHHCSHIVGSWSKFLCEAHGADYGSCKSNIFYTHCWEYMKPGGIMAADHC